MAPGMRRRDVSRLVALVAVFCGATVPAMPLFLEEERVPVRDETNAQLVLEETLRDMALRDWATRKRGTLYVSIKGRDPDPARVARWRAAGLPVRAGSGARPTGGIVLKDGYKLDLGAVAWVAGDMARLGVSAWCGNLCAEWGYYTFVLRGDGWTLLNYRVTMVS